MNARSIRLLLRAAHFVLAGCLAAVIYMPTSWTEPLRLVLGAVVVPLVIATGLAMWQQARLRRLFARKRVRPVPAQPGDRS